MNGKVWTQDASYAEAEQVSSIREVVAIVFLMPIRISKRAHVGRCGRRPLWAGNASIDETLPLGCFYRRRRKLVVCHSPVSSGNLRVCEKP